MIVFFILQFDFLGAALVHEFIWLSCIDYYDRLKL